MNLHIYALHSASLCDYGIKIQLYNSFTAINVIMLELKNNKQCILPLHLSVLGMGIFGNFLFWSSIGLKKWLIEYFN